MLRIMGVICILKYTYPGIYINAMSIIKLINVSSLALEDSLPHLYKSN